MAKVNLIDITSATSSGNVSIQNTNNDALAAAIEKTLSRDGTSPNEMDANLDMNSNRILNLPAPINASEPVRLVDLQNATFVEGGGGAPAEDELVEADVAFVDIPLVTIDESVGSFRTGGYSTTTSNIGSATVRRVASEPTHEGKIQSLDGAWWEISPYQEINIEQFGAATTATGSENLTAIQNCVEFCSAYGVPTHIPQGTYTVSGSILYDAGNHFIGKGKASRITGSVSGYIFNRSANNGTTPLCNTVFRSLAIENAATLGNGIWVARGIGFKIESCDVRTRLIGAYVDYQAFDVTFDTCTFVQQQQNQASGSIGILSHHHTAIINCDITHWETAIRKWNQSGLILGGRLEVCKTGIMLGRTIDLVPEWARGTLIAGVAFEACDSALVVRQGEGITVTACVVQGTSGSPSGGSIVGFDFQDFNGCTVTGNSVTGEFSTACVRALATWDSVVIEGNYFAISGGGGSVYVDGGFVHVNSRVECNANWPNALGTPRTIYSGNLAATSATYGTDTTPGATTEDYRCEINIPTQTTITGIAVLLGPTVAGNATVSLCSRSDVPIAAAKSASTALSVTGGYQRIPFASSYRASPGKYFIAVQFNNTGAHFRTHPFGNFGTEKLTGGTYGTFVTGGNPGTFTADVGPIVSLY